MTAALVSEADPLRVFFEAVGACLDEAVHNFKAKDIAAATRSLANAVELCESHPTYATYRSANLGSSLQKVVHGIITNAIARGRSGPEMLELLTRIEAVSQFPFH